MLYTTPLFPPGEDDFMAVVEAVYDVAAKWEPLGHALRIRPAELTTLSAKHHSDPNECLRGMLSLWLRQSYDTKLYGEPSWRLLCRAIDKRAGTNNPELAKKIARQHSCI